MLSPQKRKASVRLRYEITMMREYLKKKGIEYKQIAELSGITAPNVWRFLECKSPEPSTLTFLLIAEAIGYKIDISMPVPEKTKKRK